jgi:hypothetical protein
MGRCPRTWRDGRIKQGIPLYHPADLVGAKEGGNKMEWIMLALIIGAVRYCALIIVEYTNFSLQVRPRISGIETDSVELVRDMDAISLERDGIRLRVESLKSAVGDLGERTRDLRSRLQVEKARKQCLDMEYFKQRLKGR